MPTIAANTRPRRWATSVQGVTPEFLSVRSWAVAEGTFFSDTEVAPSLMGAVERERARMLLDLYVPGEIEDAALWDIRVRSTNKEYEIEGTRFRLWPWAPPDLHAVGGVHLGEQRARHGNRPGKVQMFQLGVRLKDMDYEREGDDMVANFSLGVRIETEDGRQLVDSPHVFRHAFPVARWDAAGDSTLGIRGFLEAPPGDYKLVAEFRNTKTRKTGLIVQEIHIP